MSRIVCELVLVPVAEMHECNLHNVTRQVQESDSRYKPVGRIECSVDQSQCLDVERNIQVPAGEASQDEVYGWRFVSRHHRGAASAMSRCARYQSTVR